jgi:hypothetical protein
VSGTVLADTVDYLVGMIRALPVCAAPVQVSDGWPGTFQAQTLVCVGGGPEDSEQSTSRTWLGVGSSRTREETFQVLVYIRAWTGGTTQKTSRDKAVSIYKAVEAALLADMRLGALLFTYPAEIGDMDISQTKADTAQVGRLTEIRFTVNVRNRY